jgi:hypothetical protein
MTHTAKTRRGNPLPHHFCTINKTVLWIFEENKVPIVRCTSHYVTHGTQHSLFSDEASKAVGLGTGLTYALTFPYGLGIEKRGLLQECNTAAVCERVL